MLPVPALSGLVVEDAGVVLSGEEGDGSDGEGVEVAFGVDFAVLLFWWAEDGVGVEGGNLSSL